MKLLFFKVMIISIVVTNAIFAQNLTIQIEGAEGKAALFSLEGEKATFVDSISLANNSQYIINSSNFHIGFYRLILAENKFLDLIYNGNTIILKTDLSNILDSLRIKKSESNKIYYNFIKLNKGYKTKTELLQLILARYPKEDAYYLTTQNKLSEIQNEYVEFKKLVTQAEPQKFIARYVKSAQLPVIPQNISIEEQLNYLKLHTLDNVDFNDAGLIYSDVFTNKSIEYLTYYRNPQLPKDLLEKEFMKAVDTLLNKAKANQLVYQHITEYLIDGFKKFGFDKIIDYIVENYVIEDDLCLDEETENSIQRRIDQSKLLPIGVKAPNFIMSDIDGKIIDLSKINSDKTLLIFYASWCPHCQELLPQLNEFSKSNKDIEILAISLDSKQEDWIKFVDDNKLELININDPNGWDGTAASYYYIYATPTMFLLDNEKKIFGKPTTYNELLEVIDSY